MEWFQAGGFGMFLVLALGAGGIGYGIKTLKGPTAERLAVLRLLPVLIGTAALFSFGTGLWAMNRKVPEETWAKMPWIGFIGLTEAAQTLTLGGLLAMVVVALAVVAEAKKPKP